MSDGLQALSAKMRPVDALSAAGLGQLAGLVVPLQGVLDRLAGNASEVHSFVDAWNSVSQRIAQIQQQFGQSVASGTAEWRGASADKYRQRADDFAKSLAQFARVAAAASKTAKTTAETVAAGRSTANDLISDLVQRLISLVRQLMAAEGGMTPTVLAQAGQLVNSFAKPVANVERQVGSAVSNAAKPLGDLLTTINAITRLWASYAGKPEQAPLIRTRGALSLPETRVHPKSKSKSKMGAEAFSDGEDVRFADKNKSEHTVGHEAAHVLQQRAGQQIEQSGRTRGLVAPDVAHPAEEGSGPPPSDESVRPASRGLVAHDVAHPGQQMPAPPPSGDPQRPNTRNLLAHELAHPVQQVSGPVLSDESVGPVGRGFVADDGVRSGEETPPPADEPRKPQTRGLVAHEVTHVVQQRSGKP